MSCIIYPGVQMALFEACHHSYWEDLRSPHQSIFTALARPPSLGPNASVRRRWITCIYFASRNRMFIIFLDYLGLWRLEALRFCMENLRNPLRTWQEEAGEASFLKMAGGSKSHWSWWSRWFVDFLCLFYSHRILEVSFKRRYSRCWFCGAGFWVLNVFHFLMEQKLQQVSWSFGISTCITSLHRCLWCFTRGLTLHVVESRISPSIAEAVLRVILGKLYFMLFHCYLVSEANPKI